MKILWVCNVLPPMVADKLNTVGSNKEGWISGALVRMMNNGTVDGKVKLSIAYPVNSISEELSRKVNFEKNSFEVGVYGYYEDQVHPEKYSSSLEERFQKIIKEVNPDIIHIFGTEYGHTLAICRVVNNLGKNAPKLLIGIQGIIHRCGEEYTAALPNSIVNSSSFRDTIKADNIAAQQKKFLARGEMETEALKLCNNVTGRTDFDKEYLAEINPNAKYYFMNETLRSSFYDGCWDVTECYKHSIFISQADYPLKGFHILLEAMPLVLGTYPDAKIVVAGANIVAYDTLKDKLKIGSYGKYLRSLIFAYNLQDKIVFTGRLNEEEMRQHYLKCHTFVCPSSLENSPNSLGEAMILGVPVVASRTGGIPSMLEEEEDGLLFEVGDGEGLAKCILRIWDDDAFATELGAKAMNRARITHDAEINYKRLIEIYEQIV